MHIPDGILPAAVCAAGYATTGAATWVSLRKINQQADPRAGIPKASLLTSAFFVASWIHVPVPPTSAHLVLNGLLGATLGYYAFPAILIGLFFQAVMFQHGGLTTLGVNAAMMGVPALLAYYIFRLRGLVDKENRVWTAVFGFVAGAVGLGVAALIAMVLLITTIPAHLDVEAERASIYALTTAHVPLMLIEGLFTALVVLFLQRVKPELLEQG
jgi:cobalt/nickel transport system permease protein